MPSYDVDKVKEFQRVYGRSGSSSLRDLEHSVIGADYGANGYTTRAEADRLGVWLGLGPGTRLLDLGSGRGWPGLYLAATTGCHVILSDLPPEGLVRARRRAHREGIAGRAQVVVAEGTQPPARRATFHAVVHTDVIC